MEIKNFFAQDAQGNIMPSADCYLYLSGTTTLASGLIDVDGLPIANPFKASLIGQVEFGAPNGVYDLRIIRGARDTTIRIQCADLLQAIDEIGAFLGAHATPPTTRNDGTALQIADRYLNTTDQLEYIYKSSGWASNDIADVSDFGRELIGQPDAEAAKTLLALENVDNTADLQKPISDPQKDFLLNGTGSGIGYNSGYTNSKQRTQQSKSSEVVSVFDFMTESEIEDVLSGTRLLDHTASIQLFINATKGLNNTQFRSGLFPRGDYNITQIVFEGGFDTDFYFDGSRFHWIGTAATDGAIKLVNAVHLAMRGNWIVNGYDSLLLENAQISVGGPGDGVIIPIGGVSENVIIDGLFGYRCKNVLQIGRYDDDISVAGTMVSNLRSELCPGVLTLSGSQSGAMVANSNLLSQPGNFGIGDVSEHAIKMEGGYMTVDNCTLTHISSDSGALIHITPCKSALYGNIFPTLMVGNTHVESAAMIMLVNNPRGLTNPNSVQAAISLNVQGYDGAFAASGPLVIVDVSQGFEGSIKMPGGNLYSGATQRTGKNIAFTTASPLATVDVSPKTFGAGHQPWMGGVLNGKLLHGPMPAVSASNLAGQSVAASTASTLRWTASNTLGNYARYGFDYSTATGILSVHPSGVSALRLKTNLALTSRGTGYVEVLRNNVRVYLKSLLSADYSVLVDYEEVDVPGGTTYQVRVTVDAGSIPVSFGSSTNDTLTVTYTTE